MWRLPVSLKQRNRGLQAFCCYKTFKPILFLWHFFPLTLLWYRSQKQLRHLTYRRTSCWLKTRAHYSWEDTKHHFLMHSTLSAQQASCHFKGKLVILIFPKQKYYKNIMHLIGLTKCFCTRTYQHTSYKTKYKVSRCCFKYLKLFCKRQLWELPWSLLIKLSCSSYNP